MWKDFQAKNNNELVAILGNFVNRSLVLTNNYFGGIAPARSKTDDYDEKVLSEIERIRNNIEPSLESFRFRDALREAMNLARLGNKYLADTEPWKIHKSDPEKVKTIINIALQITANLTIILEPFLPFTTKKLRGWLNCGKFSWAEAGRSDLIPPGHAIKKPGLLFEKIEDDVIEKQINKLRASLKTNNDTGTTVIPPKETVSFDLFSRIDIRTATVLEAEKVPRTTKLLKLTIDTGIDTRTIVSGIAEYFQPDDLVGKQISIVANLEPRKIKGIESKGMILMAEDSGGKLVLVSPAEKTGNGSIIK